MCDVTRILGKIEAGDPSAAEQLLPLVYDELRKLAARKMAQEQPGQTLQATALVHEAYLRLVDVENAQHWNGRGHFFGAAAEAMRQILVDRARQKICVKRGGGMARAGNRFRPGRQPGRSGRSRVGPRRIGCAGGRRPVGCSARETPLLRRLLHRGDCGDSSFVPGNYLSPLDLRTCLAACRAAGPRRARIILEISETNCASFSARSNRGPLETRP